MKRLEAGMAAEHLIAIEFLGVGLLGGVAAGEETSYDAVS